MRYVLALSSVFIYLIFIRTSCPTVYMGDSGEMTAAAFTLGIGHPPGYPLYMLAAKIFSFLPAGDVAFRINLFSASIAVLAFLLMYFTSLNVLLSAFKKKEDLLQRLVGLATAYIFVFSYMTWFQAVQAKGAVYLMTHVLELAGIMFCLKFMNEKKPRYFYLAAFIAGFMPAAHHSAGAIMLFVLCALALNMKHLSGAQKASGLVFFLLSFLTPYLYLFIRAKAAPVVCWGDIRDFEQVINHITRKVYFAHQKGLFTADVVFHKLRLYLSQFAYGYRAAALLVAAGFVFLFMNSKKMFFTFLAFIAVNLGGLIYLTMYSFAPFIVYMNSGFYIIVDVALALAAGAGAYGFISLISGKKDTIRVAAASALFVIPLAGIFSFFPVNDQSRKFMAYDNALNVLKTLKDGDHLFTEEDFQVFNVLYVKYVRGMFPGIKAYDRSANYLDTSVFAKFRDAGMEQKLSVKARNQEELNFMMLRYTEKLEKAAEYQVILANPGRVYFTPIPDFLAMKLVTRPYGILFTVGPKEKMGFDASALMQIYTIRDFFNNRQLDLYYRDVVARYFVQRAKYAAMKKGVESGFYAAWAESIAHDSGAVLNLIAEVYYSDLGDTATAIKYMEKIMYLNPYDYAALDVLIRFCMESDAQKAVKWLWHYYKVALNDEMRNAILIQINKLTGE